MRACNAENQKRSAKGLILKKTIGLCLSYHTVLIYAAGGSTTSTATTTKHYLYFYF